jgi:hypothetical protein
LISVSHFTQLFPFSLWPVTTLRNFMFLYPPRCRNKSNPVHSTNSDRNFLPPRDLLFQFRIQDRAGGTALPQKILEPLTFYLDMISFKTSLLFFKEKDPKVKEND